MAVYPIWQATIQNAQGDIVPGAQISVVDEGTGLLATIYSTRTGGAQVNPFLAGSDGFAQFYAPAGTYRITAKNLSTLEERVWRYVRLVGADPLVSPQYAARATGNGSATTFNSSISVYDNPENFDVRLDGLSQRPTTNYAVSQTGQIVFTTPPPVGAAIDIVYMAMPASGQNVEQFSDRVLAVETTAATNTTNITAATATANYAAALAAQQDRELAAFIQNYKQQKSFVNLLPSDPTTFTRASSATYFDVDGVMQTAASGVKRYTHDPLTLQPLGLLIEEQRTNTVLYSNDLLNTTGWASTRAVFSLFDSATNAYKLTEDSSLGTHYGFAKTVSFIAGTTYSMSAEFKAGERSIVNMQLPIAAFGVTKTAYFDLLSGVIVAGGNSDAAYITATGNGWYRCTMVGTATVTASANTIICAIVNSGTNITYQGDNVSGLYIRRPQIEAGSFPSSYIPTTNAAVTRVADTLTDTVNTATYLNGSRGTVFADFYVPYLNSSGSGANGRQVVWRIRNSATNNFLALMYEGAKLRLLAYNGSTNSYTDLTGVISTTQRNKVAISYNVIGNTFTPAISINGATVAGVAVSGFDMPSPVFYIGTESSIRYLNGTLSRLTYYKRALSQAELNGLTA